MEAHPGEETKKNGTKGSTVIWKKKNPRGAERPTPELDREVEDRDREPDRVVGLIRAAEIREVTPLRRVLEHTRWF